MGSEDAAKVIGVVVCIVVLLIVILIPSSFHGVEYYQVGLRMDYSWLCLRIVWGFLKWV